MKDEYDVIIIGAGPAGLSCAVGLQQAQKTVLILEKRIKKLVQKFVREA